MFVCCNNFIWMFHIKHLMTHYMFHSHDVLLVCKKYIFSIVSWKHFMISKKNGAVNWTKVKKKKTRNWRWGRWKKKQNNNYSLSRLDRLYIRKVAFPLKVLNIIRVQNLKPFQAGIKALYSYNGPFFYNTLCTKTALGQEKFFGFIQ